MSVFFLNTVYYYYQYYYYYYYCYEYETVIKKFIHCTGYVDLFGQQFPQPQHTATTNTTTCYYTVS